jgi:nucleoside-diphosphate-sugar epimerase
MNLLVGCTGFVGGHVVEYLFQQNEISRGIFRKGAHLKILDLNGVQGVEADLLDPRSLHEAMDGVETVFSMASPMPDQDQDFERINVEGISNLLQAAQEARVGAIVHLSTLDVYGFRSHTVNPKSETKPSAGYQRSKLRADETLLAFAKSSPSPRVVIIRAAKAVGSRDASLVVPLLRMIDGGTVTLPSSGEMSFSHPRDIADAMYRALTNPKLNGRVYLIKSFDVAPEAFAAALATEMGKKVSIKKHDLGTTRREIAEWCKRDPWAKEQH